MKKVNQGESSNVDEILQIYSDYMALPNIKNLASAKNISLLPLLNEWESVVREVYPSLNSI